jgi:hypothetical protein
VSSAAAVDLHLAQEVDVRQHIVVAPLEAEAQRCHQCEHLQTEGVSDDLSSNPGSHQTGRTGKSASSSTVPPIACTGVLSVLYTKAAHPRVLGVMGLVPQTPPGRS